MLEFLFENFGVSAKEKSWDGEKKLPLYLRKGRKYSVLQIEDKDILCIRITDDEFKVASYLKQLDKLSSYWSNNILLEFNSITAYQRKTLIEFGIAFIVPGSQIYIPFLGMLFKECARKRQLTKKDALSIASQLILLIVLDQGIKEFRQIDMQKLLCSSPMKVSRAVNELAAFELLKKSSKGREHVYSVESSMSQLYERSSEFLENPVSRTIYIKETDLPDNLPLAGETALSHYSMLNPPNVNCYAMWRTEFNKTGLTTVDPNWEKERYVKLELWSYDPKLLSANGYIREIPLRLSLKDETDERVEGAIEEMMENYKW